jgi:hypothetical protein
VVVEEQVITKLQDQEVQVVEVQVQDNHQYHRVDQEQLIQAEVLEANMLPHLEMQVVVGL